MKRKKCSFCQKPKVRHTKRTAPARSGPKTTVVNGKKQMAQCSAPEEYMCGACLREKNQ